MSRLEDLVRAGLFAEVDVRLARFLGDHYGCDDDDVLLAAALAARAPRYGAVLADLADPPQADEAAPWPEPSAWAKAVSQSPLARADAEGGPSPLVVDGTRIYLRRYFEEERSLAERLLERAGASETAAATPEENLLGHFLGDEAGDAERRAATRALAGKLLLLMGGPGTGKTTLVARLVGVLQEARRLQELPPAEVLLAAPTGKAAARLREAVSGVLGSSGLDAEIVPGSVRHAETIHRALGLHLAPGASPRHHRSRPLPYDVVVVDEASMVDLTLFRRLVDAVADDALLVLVGDPDQLASVEAGAVLGDLARVERGPIAEAVVRLERRHRFAEAGGIAGAAAAVQRGDARALCEELERRRGEEIEWVRLPEGDAMGEFGRLVEEAAGRYASLAETENDAESLAALSRFRLLTSHRVGPFGCDRINRLLEERFGGRRAGGPYPGRPILVGRNDPLNGLFHGDVGIVREKDGRLVACFEDPTSPGTPRPISVHRLPEHEPVYAMTIHKAQGSEFDEVWLLLAPVESPLLTRELLFTGVTRARRRLRIAATEAVLEAACARRVRRPSGLRERLEGPRGA